MTQTEKVYAHMQRAGSITSMEAFTKYKITRLASCIHILRCDGHPITTENVTRKDGSHYGRYRLHTRK